MPNTTLLREREKGSDGHLKVAATRRKAGRSVRLKAQHNCGKNKNECKGGRYKGKNRAPVSSVR